LVFKVRLLNATPGGKKIKKKGRGGRKRNGVNSLTVKEI